MDLAQTLVAERLLAVLDAERASSDIERYFAEPDDGASTFTGRLFERFGLGGDGPGVASAFVADDLVAVQALSVRVPPDTAFALLHGELGELLGELLRDVPTDVDLGSSTSRLHVAPDSPADRAWRLLVAQPGIEWVTAGKLLARKRPRLIPVYDGVVRCVLGRPDHVWLTLDAVLADPVVRDALASLRGAAPAHVSALRLTDVATWMRHHSEHAQKNCTLYEG